MGEIVSFPGTIDVSLDDKFEGDDNVSIEGLILGLTDNNIKTGIFIGRDENNKFYVASTTRNIGKLLVFLEGAKMMITSQIDISSED